MDCKINATRIPVGAVLPSGHSVGDTSLWSPLPTTVLANTATVVDSTVVIPGHDTIKWMVSVKQPSTNNTYMFEMVGYYQNMDNPNVVVYGMLGSQLSVAVAVSVVDLNLVLTVTNNELSPINVFLVRLPVSI
jgi:hypothetical protein